MRTEHLVTTVQFDCVTVIVAVSLSIHDPRSLHFLKEKAADSLAKLEKFETFCFLTTLS